MSLHLWLLSSPSPQALTCVRSARIFFFAFFFPPLKRAEIIFISVCILTPNGFRLVILFIPILGRQDSRKQDTVGGFLGWHMKGYSIMWNVCSCVYWLDILGSVSSESFLFPRKVTSYQFAAQLPFNRHLNCEIYVMDICLKRTEIKYKYIYYIFFEACAGNLVWFKDDVLSHLTI